MPARKTYHVYLRCILYFVILFFATAELVQLKVLCFRSVCASVHASRTLLTQYLEKYWTYFHQTFSIGAFWDKDACVKFWVKRSKFKVKMVSNMLEYALFGLVNVIS